MEAEGRELLESVVADLLAAAIAHDPAFPAEYIIEAELPEDIPNSVATRAQKLAERFAKDFVREYD